MIPHHILLLIALLGILAPAQALDYGDHTSATITHKAWEALAAQRFDDAVGYARKCIELYEKQAVETQKGLAEPVPGTDREAVFKFWALNDVGTCFFIMGQALEKQEKGVDALGAYRQLVEKVPFAQTWDPQGWFWKPADAAKARIRVLEFDTLK